MSGECVEAGRALAPSDLDAMCINLEQARVNAAQLLAQSPEQVESISLEQAAELLGENFLGPQQFETTFGFRPESLDPSQEMVERAKRLDMMLVLHVAENDQGKPLSMKAMNDQLSNEDGKLLYDDGWYRGEDFYTAAPRLGWRLVAKEPLPDSANKNAVEQLQQIVDWLREIVFADMEMPEEYAQAIAQFENQKAQITRLMNSRGQWPEASQKIAGLQLAQLTLPNPAELIQTIAVHQQTTGNYLLPNVYARTAVPASDGHLGVRVGRAGARGAEVLGDHPGPRYSPVDVLPSLQS